MSLVVVEIPSFFFDHRWSLYKGLIQLFLGSRQEGNIFMVTGLLKQITISNNSISVNLIDFIARGERNLNLNPLHFLIKR